MHKGFDRSDLIGSSLFWSFSRHIDKWMVWQWWWLITWLITWLRFVFYSAKSGYRRDFPFSCMIKVFGIFRIFKIFQIFWDLVMTGFWRCDSRKLILFWGRLVHFYRKFGMTRNLTRYMLFRWRTYSWWQKLLTKIIDRNWSRKLEIKIENKNFVDIFVMSPSLLLLNRPRDGDVELFIFLCSHPPCSDVADCPIKFVFLPVLGDNIFVFFSS